MLFQQQLGDGKFKLSQRDIAARAAEYDEDSSYPMLAAGEWTVCMIPRTEWVGDLDGHWRELLGRVPLAINESLGTTTD